MTTKPPTASHRVFSVAGIALAAMLACAPAQAQPVSSGTEAYASGRILIMPRAGLSDRALANVLKQQGGGKARRVGNSNLRIVDLPRGAERRMVDRLKRHPHIKFAELDQLVPLNSSNDPFYGSQWHLPKIAAPAAWANTTGSGVTIAILDTGVDGTHPDLKDRMVPGYNFYDKNTDTRDVHGHGTAVAGTAAAALNNGTGVASVAGAAMIMPVRISDLQGYGSWSAFTEGLTWAADRGARVANISYLVSGSASVQSAAGYFKSKGGLVVTSAGNYGKDEGIIPSDTMISVSATTSSDSLTSWSSYGTFVDVSAPGAGIYTSTRGGGYGSMSGTSFSSPVTAGVVALMMAANSKLAPTDVEKLLFASTVDLGAAGYDIYYGWGRVDANAAVQAALHASSSADTQAPAASINSPGGSSTVSGLVAVDVSASDDKGVARVDLLVNGSKVASDSSAPFAFSWDSTKVTNGTVELKAVAVDAAGNVGASAPVAVNVANPALADTTPPTVAVTNPNDGSTVSGTVKISVSASDDSGSAGINNQLYIGGKLVASGTGGSLSYSWNTRRVKKGSYTIQAIAKDAAGNVSATSVSVTR